MFLKKKVLQICCMNGNDTKKQLIIFGLILLLLIVSFSGCTQPTQPKNEQSDYTKLIVGTWNFDPNDLRNNKSHPLYNEGSINFFSNGSFTTNSGMKGNYSILMNVDGKNYLEMNDYVFVLFIGYSGSNPSDPSTWIITMYINETTRDSKIIYHKE